MRIPFNKPFLTGKELSYIQQAADSGKLSGDGQFTKKCNEWLEKRVGSKKALLTHSCTAALEMAALLCNIKPGDEVIIPSFTFVSSANAFVLRGAKAVWVDIRTDTLNIDENLIEAAITPKTKAIVPVHYAGVGCEMDKIGEIAKKHNLSVIEDAAQGIMSEYKGKALGSFGDMSALSFHDTKNIVSGEGGALLLNHSELFDRAEIIREKGTNRSRFFRGQVDKYTWVDVGSSFLPSELNAAFLWAQMEEANKITALRLDIWNKYHAAFADFEKRGIIKRPTVPAHCKHNAHMYYLLLPDLAMRTRFIQEMAKREIGTVFHYVPLHDSPAGMLYGRKSGSMKNTTDCSDRLVRLPLWAGMTKEVQEHCISEASSALELLSRS